MGTIACPHCGKQIYDGLVECPDCHGPIEANIEIAIDEIVEERNKKEKKNLITSIVLGVITGVLLTAMFISMNMGDNIMQVIGIGLLMIVFYPLMFYGISVVFRKLKGGVLWGFILFPVVGWMIGLVVILYAGALGGIVITPIALIKLFTKKPLVSKEKILKELEKAN